MARLSPGRVVCAALLCALAAAAPWAHAATDSATGSGSVRILPFVELVTSDGTVAAFNVAPSSADPGPRAWSNVDGLSWSGRWTNTRHVVLLDVSQATDSGGSATKTVQGTVHTIADWVHQRQAGGSAFGAVSATGVYDAAAGAYTAPGGFSKDSQGTVSLRLYDQTSPPDGGTTTVVSWIYDAAQNRYWFDATDKDFTNGNGEVSVYPAAKKGVTAYTFGVSGLTYGVGAVAGAGADYVPTVRLAWNALPGVSGGGSFASFSLIDLPSGTPKDTYSFTVRASILATK